MTRNIQSEFAGTTEMKRRHAEQLAAFEAWAIAGEWNKFHEAHYDWWMFPIDQPSSFGFKWSVYDGDIDEMKSDKNYLTGYRWGLELAALAWGWHLKNAKEVPHPQPGQCWHDWPVRLYKMTLSAQLFEEHDSAASLKTYGRLLIGQGQNMRYMGKDLSGIFLEA